MTPDQERWAEALAVLRMYGDRVFAHIVERADTLSRAGVVEGARRWIEIAGKLDEIHDAQERPQ